MFQPISNAKPHSIGRSQCGNPVIYQVATPYSYGVLRWEIVLPVFGTASSIELPKDRESARMSNMLVPLVEYLDSYSVPRYFQSSESNTFSDP